jgi:hypothetical protein
MSKQWAFAYHARCIGEPDDNSTIYDVIPILPGGDTLKVKTEDDANEVVDVSGCNLYLLDSFQSMLNLFDKYGIVSARYNTYNNRLVNQTIDNIRFFLRIVESEMNKKSYQRTKDKIMTKYVTLKNQRKYNNDSKLIDQLRQRVTNVEHTHNEYCTDEFCVKIYNDKSEFLAQCLLLLDVLYGQLTHHYIHKMQREQYESINYDNMRDDGYDGVHFSAKLFEIKNMFKTNIDMQCIVNNFDENETIVLFRKII